MRPIDADRLLKRLGMARKCEDCPNQLPIKGMCGLSAELEEVCDEIESAPMTDYTEWLEEQIEPMLGEWVCDLFAWAGSDYCETHCTSEGVTIKCLRAAFEAERSEDATN